MMLNQPLFGFEQEIFTSDDYYTPPWVFETLGLEFDLDVASPPGGVPWIPAKRYFTMADDGLNQPWEGKVWMNPPFSKPGPWLQRFIDHRDGVACVVPARSIGFGELWDVADGMIRFPHNMKWHTNKGFIKCSFLTVLVAFGEENVEAIGRLGRVR